MLVDRTHVVECRKKAYKRPPIWDMVRLGE